MNEDLLFLVALAWAYAWSWLLMDAIDRETIIRRVPLWSFRAITGMAAGFVALSTAVICLWAA